MTEWGIDTLFNPGKRHMDEEKRRLQSTREEIGDSSGGRRIDLESGTVTISRRNKDAPQADTTADSAEAESAEAESAEAQSAAADSAEAEAEDAEGEEAEADDAASAQAEDAQAAEAGPQR